MSAYDAAVEALAWAIMRPDVRAHYEAAPDPEALAYYRERARDGLAALRAEAVRVAMVEAARHEYITEGVNDGSPWRRTELHVVRPCCIDAFLAALQPEAT